VTSTGHALGGRLRSCGGVRNPGVGVAVVAARHLRQVLLVRELIIAHKR
jgi:hypothetical protein